MECTVISIVPPAVPSDTTITTTSTNDDQYNSKHQQQHSLMNYKEILVRLMIRSSSSSSSSRRGRRNHHHHHHHHHHNNNDLIFIIHSIKVGIALVLVSLLYLLDPLFNQVGENAMWAIMTVVVVFEFYAGGTVSKGINRGIGTIIGGGLGCLSAILADEAGKFGKPIVIATSVFIVGAVATYTRLIPRVKRRYDYGVMIFILTFNLVAMSGLRADIVMKLAKQRLSTIGMGFLVCIFTSLLIFPVWASDQLHSSTANMFHQLASSIEVCLEEYLTSENIKEKEELSTITQVCNSVLHSKSKDENLANFAKWEPWHGKFGFSHPWEKYLEIGEVLRELAAIIISLHTCIQSPKLQGYQGTMTATAAAAAEREDDERRIKMIKEPCEMIGLSVTWILRELGDSITKMKKCESNINKISMVQKHHESMKEQLSLLMNYYYSHEHDDEGGRRRRLDPDEHFANVTFCFLLIQISNKAQLLVEKVQIFADHASF